MENDLQNLIKYHCAKGARWDQNDLIALLRETQELCGGILKECVLDSICKELDLKPSYLKVVMKYVPDLKTEKERHKLEVCNGNNCQSNDNLCLRKWIEQTYQVRNKGISERGEFSYHLCGCMKKCKEGPCVKWDGKVYTNMTPKQLEKLISEN